MIGRFDKLHTDANAGLVTRLAITVDLFALGCQAKAKRQLGVFHEFQKRAALGNIAYHAGNGWAACNSDPAA